MHSSLPTTDLYFLNSCKDLVTCLPWQKRPIKQIGANTFRSGNCYLLIRRDCEQVMKKLLTYENAKIIYLLDDDIWAAVEDLSLPDEYRRKLAQLTSGPLSDIIEKTAHFIISSKMLLKALPSKIPVSLLSPNWQSYPTDAIHFKQDTLRLVHLGTNSHKAGFNFLQPILEKILENSSNISFTYYSNKPLLCSLDKHPRVSRHKILRWEKYKNHIGKERFHLGLYPMIDTPFNRGRSHNKILEYSLIGCAAIFSKNWNHSSLIEHGKNGWICENNENSWINTILSLAKEPKQLLAGFHGASKLFYRLNDLKSQRAFWKRLLLEE